MQKVYDRKVYSEVYAIMNILGEEFIESVPSRIYELIEAQRDKNYNPNLLKEDGTLNENLISKDAIALFAVIDMGYFVTDEIEKEKFIEKIKANEQKVYEETYDVNDIFKPKNSVEQEKEEIKMITYEEENIFKKILKKIKKFFKK